MRPRASAWERTPWHATQRAAWDALKKKPVLRHNLRSTASLSRSGNIVEYVMPDIRNQIVSSLAIPSSGQASRGSPHPGPCVLLYPKESLPAAQRVTVESPIPNARIAMSSGTVFPDIRFTIAKSPA